ncbi:ABC transporter ATP-binding protein [Maridesulfovibrio sp.]|uniref:energy-coupling factor ABC transporter ATP-binding protein n=1 Tax=Maridesulfovibrio sp. TaxID=2795000 RepID=UPI002A1885EB|nr:ABC transporter ATP-binding protein [Maridesulfovibrio sp.]
MSPIEIENFTYSYASSASPALHDLNFEIGAGEFVALIGANNSGKSTLCNALCGAVPQLYHGEFDGNVRVCGKDISATSLAELSESVALVMQHPERQLSGIRFTVAEEVGFSLENRGVDRAEILERVDEALVLTGLSNLAERSPHHLSGGQLQKVTLASALACDTPVLVLDEPTTFLDPMAARQVFEILDSLRSKGKTIVLAEQRLESIAIYADRVIAFHEGRIVLDGPPAEVLVSPLIKDIGLDWTRFSKVAELARKRARWAEGRALATTYGEVVEGLEVRNDN